MADAEFIIISGGAGTGASKSDDNGGMFAGSTAATWANCQGTNGAALFHDTNAAAASHDGGAATKINKTGIGTASVVGVFANVDFDAGIADDRYEIIEIIDADNIALDVAWDGGASQADEIWVGGALSTLTEAKLLVNNLTATDAMISQNTVSSSTITWDAGGNKTGEKWLHIRGVSNVDGSDLPAGTYVSATSTAANDVFVWDDIANVWMTGIWLKNAFDENGAGLYINNGAANYNYKIKNCKFSSNKYGVRAISTNVRNLLLDNCVYLGNTTNDLISNSTDTYVVNCLILSDIANPVSVGQSSVFENCHFVAGQTALKNTATYPVFVKNCTFYNQTVACVENVSSVGGVIAYNNIFMPATTADKAVLLTGGTVIEFDYNCLSSVGGGACANDTTTDGGNNIAADPLFTDAGAGDFSLQGASPCIGAGMLDVGDGEHDIGAVAFWNAVSANYPAVGDVEEAVDYGHNDQFTGTFAEPGVGNVLAGVQYGADGTEFTGTLDVTEPGAPSFTVADGTNAVTVTIDGDAGVTNYVRYKGSADADWLDGGNIVGDGDVEITGLANDVPYIIMVYSVDGAGNSSVPGVAVNVTLAAAVSNEIDNELICMAVEQLDTSGEDVTYWPLGGGLRQIRAIVDRNNIERTVVWVANDSVIGISSSEVDTGGGKIEIARRKYNVPVKRRLTDLGAHDAGMVSFELKGFTHARVEVRDA